MSNEYYYGQLDNNRMIRVQWFFSDNLKVGSFGVLPVDGTRQADFIDGKYTVYKQPKPVTIYQVVQRVHPGYVITWQEIYSTKREAYNAIRKAGYELPEVTFENEVTQ